MFGWFRRRRKALVPVLTAAFLASLFSFYCPHCLAKMAMETAGLSIKDNGVDHCSHREGNKLMPAGTHKHCNGVCDCAGNSKIFASAQAVTPDDVKTHPGTRIAIRDDFYRPLPSMSFLTYIVGRPYKPDRACYPPLERICVLLN